MMKDLIFCLWGLWWGEDNTSNELKERKKHLCIKHTPTPFKLATNDFVVLDIHIFINL